VQAGAFAEYWPVQWLRLRSEVRQGIGGETGVTGDVFLDAIVPVGQFRLSAGPRLTAQSTAAISPYFSITPAQSIGSTAAGLPALPVYHADGVSIHTAPEARWNISSIRNGRRTASLNFSG